MYLCGESEEIVFKRANYDLTSMLMNILGVERIKLAEVEDVDKALMFMIFVVALSSFLVVVWISLRGL
jgi:hypothetical protein